MKDTRITTLAHLQPKTGLMRFLMILFASIFLNAPGVTADVENDNCHDAFEHIHTGTITEVEYGEQGELVAVVLTESSTGETYKITNDDDPSNDNQPEDNDRDDINQFGKKLEAAFEAGNVVVIKVRHDDMIGLLRQTPEPEPNPQPDERPDGPQSTGEPRTG